jgi:hypothetical protein
MGYISELINQEANVKNATDNLEKENLKTNRMIVENFAKPFIDALNEVFEGDFYFTSDAHINASSRLHKIMLSKIESLYSKLLSTNTANAEILLRGVAYGFNVTCPSLIFKIENGYPKVIFKTGYGNQCKEFYSFESFAPEFAQFIAKHEVKLNS